MERPSATRTQSSAARAASAFPQLVLTLILLALPCRVHAQVAVTVDPTAGAHPISPLIYGMNFAAPDQISVGKVALTRWGGSATTRYNYQIDVENTGSSYYFENVAGCWTAAANYCWPRPTDPMGDSGLNVLLGAALQADLTSLVTISTIGFVAKAPPPYAQPLPCGCPKSAVPVQDSFDPANGVCGNGQSGGAWVDCPDPSSTTSQAITAQWTQDWVTYLMSQFGPSNGRIIYELDNEPNLWSSTHHDVHPARLTYDELWQRMQENAAAIVQADPTALVAGYEEWGWTNFFCSDADTAAGPCSPSSPDRASHGGEELTAWILDQAAAYEQQNGQRILHALDLHYYPQGGTAPANLRSLWDPSYVDPSWINTTVELIPRMHAWVDQHYPGTLIGISEFQWPGYDTPLGAVTYAELLGIFGQQGLDYATAWSAPSPGDNAFAAYQLFRNYDGAGSAFQSTSVQATITGTSFQSYAAVGNDQLTVVLVNESDIPVSASVSFGQFEPGAGPAGYYEISGASIVPQSIALDGGATLTVGATTAGILVVNGPNQAPDAGADAGTPDAGVDAGTDDAGKSDAGGSDAGAPDSGVLTVPSGNNPGDRQSPSGGCSCAESEPETILAALALVGLFLRARRAGRLALSTAADPVREVRTLSKTTSSIP